MGDAWDGGGPAGGAFAKREAGLRGEMAAGQGGQGGTPGPGGKAGQSSLPACPEGEGRSRLTQTGAAPLCWGRRKGALGNARLAKPPGRKTRELVRAAPHGTRGGGGDAAPSSREGIRSKRVRTRWSQCSGKCMWFWKEKRGLRPNPALRVSQTCSLWGHTQTGISRRGAS